MIENVNETRGQNGGSTPDEAARYIASLADELAKLARRHGLDVLGHLLEMARLEADQATRD
jgi:hypothetical protein